MHNNDDKNFAVGLHVYVRVDFLKVIILLTVKLRIPIVAKLTQRTLLAVRETRLTNSSNKLVLNLTCGNTGFFQRNYFLV